MKGRGRSTESTAVVRPFVDGEEAAIGGNPVAELSFGNADGVAIPAPAGELDACAVLVGPEVRHRPQGLDGSAGELVGHGDPGLLGGGRPVLGSGTADTGGVSDGDDLREGGDAAVVAQDTVVQGERRPRQPGGVRCGTDADDHDVGGEGAAVGEFHG